MNEQSRERPQGPVVAGGCDPCSPSRRTRYYRDKRMHVADYVLEQEYHISRRRLVNRAMLGWGVIQGFGIDGERLTVGPGIALDPQGRELVACDPVDLHCGEGLVWLGFGTKGCGLQVTEPPVPKGEEPKVEEQPQPVDGTVYLLAAHYAEKRVDAVWIDGGCGESRCEANQICETVVYSLCPVPCCAAGTADCRCPHCAGEDAGACTDASTDPSEDRCFTLDRGNHRQLALWSLDPLEGFDACRPARMVDVGCLSLDPDAGVPLACVRIGFECGEPRVTGLVDAALPRRLARSNEVLFDLIRGCDLTRIEAVGWRDFITAGKVSMKDFSEMFDAPAEEPVSTTGRRRRPPTPLPTRFTVRFTAPVRVATLTPDVVTMSLITRERRETVMDIVRVPILELRTEPANKCDPEGTTRGFTICVDSRFWHGEIDPQDASGFESETTVEIEVRTDWIRDCNGQEVAGGGRLPPSTGSVPGGRFLGSFTVIPDTDKDDARPASDAIRQEA